MRNVRALVRLLLFLAVTSSTFLVRVVTKPLCFHSPERNRRWRGAILRAWGRALARCIGMEMTLKGTPPPAPFLLVTNHLSYLDMALLTSHLNTVFVSRHDVRSWVFLGPIIPQFDTIFVDRKKMSDVGRVSNSLVEALERGEGVVLFAEGTSSGGHEVLPLKPALLNIAAERSLPVYYGALRYATPGNQPPADRAICWWEDMPFFPHLMRMLEIPRFSATLTLGHQPITCGDRRELAARLHEAITSEFEPLEASA